jgi:hypothetical protein
MAITVNSVPAPIDNLSAWNVTSSLSEDTSHVNMRIRGDISVAGTVVATVEKPVALSDFEFSEILTALVPGISFARNLGTAYNTTDGSPLVAYTILFTEVYETAGITTTGDTDDAGGVTFMFVPGGGDELAFQTYVIGDSTKRFANKTLRNNICKFFTYNPMEYWIVFFTSYTSLSLKWDKDGSSSGFIDFTASNGWGAIVVNTAGLMSGVTTYLGITIYASNHTTQYTEELLIYKDNSQLDERVVLEFDGLIGGKEYLAFEGIKKLEFNTIRNYYTGRFKNKKPVSFFGINNQTLETRFKDMYNADYLKSLLVSMMVKKLEPLYATPTDVTITNTGPITTGSNDLFTNQIVIESEYSYPRLTL